MYIGTPGVRRLSPLAVGIPPDSSNKSVLSRSLLASSTPILLIFASAKWRTDIRRYDMPDTWNNNNTNNEKRLITFPQLWRWVSAFSHPVENKWPLRGSRSCVYEKNEEKYTLCIIKISYDNSNTLTLNAFEELELCFLFFLPFIFAGFFVVLAVFCCFDIEADSVYFWKGEFRLVIEINRETIVHASNVSYSTYHWRSFTKLVLDRQACPERHQMVCAVTVPFPGSEMQRSTPIWACRHRDESQ